jgi:hypothetical protein
LSTARLSFNGRYVVSKFLAFLTGKKTILVAVFGGIFAMMPEWAASLDPGASTVNVIVSWVQTFWPSLAVIFGALKVNRMIDSNGG